MENEEELNNNISLLEAKLNSLKYQLQTSLKKESMYQLNLEKIKKIHSEYEESYLKSLSDYKNRENTLKNQYINFKNLLDKQNKENENRLYDELSLIKKKLKKKDEIIISLQKKNNEINNEISKNEIDYHFKEKDYEDKIIALERDINQITETSTQVAKEANQQIQQLVDQVNYFKNNSQRNYYSNFNNNINNNYINDNYNNFYNDLNAINSLEIENSFLKDEIRKKEEEINYLKNNYLNDELLNDDINKNNNDKLYNIRIIQLENKLENYYATIKNLKEIYEKSIFEHKNKIKEMKNFYENQKNDLKFNQSKNMNISNISSSILGNNNINNNINIISSSSQKNNITDCIENLNVNFPNEEGIRNQLIREKVQLIKKNAEENK